MGNVTYSLKEVVSFIEKTNYLIDHKKAKEDVIRHNFTSALSKIFYTSPPDWVTQHITGGETLARFSKDGVDAIGFIDNLIGLTAIEYEKDLRKADIFNVGLNQVKQYCASRLNEGHPKDLIIGVLSDTVRWYAYIITEVSMKKKGILGPEDITLEKIDEISAVPTEDSARKLIDFLQTYYGRIGARPLTAVSLAQDFGFESPFSDVYVDTINAVVTNAVSKNPEYAKIISRLWSKAVTQTTVNQDQFDTDTYRDELYMITLGKLICANILEQRGLVSTKDELTSILKGKYFERKGFSNLVEYDYFGWLTDSPYLEELLIVAQKLQENLQVYDFEHAFKEDLFGNMFAQLSYRTQRILLGQEWTPHWLANKMVDKLFNGLEENELPQFVDMCCGSGVMVVETIKKSMLRIERLYPDSTIDKKINLLSSSITGFDIDPLAVMLSKISWIVAAHEWITKSEGLKVTIPIYHADSLFAITPLNEVDHTLDIYELELSDNKINLPRSILTSDNKLFFDNIIDKGYKIAIQDEVIEGNIIKEISKKVASQEITRLSVSLDTNQINLVEDFLLSFIEVVNKLHVEGKNGIWAYILKNSYRPGLVSGQFNGLISNPPWLSLSKLRNNPYEKVLKSKAVEYKINPPGRSFPHIEMATIFLLHGVKNYLKDNAVVACIVPDSVLNGKHHEPFRAEKYNYPLSPVNFQINEIWKIDKHTFKNEAIVLIGNKGRNSSWTYENDFRKIPAKIVRKNDTNDIVLYNNKLGSRTAWDEKSVINETHIQHAADFQQGADILPRTFYCFDVQPTQRNASLIKSIALDSDKSFVISDVHTEKDFKIEDCYVENDVVFEVYTSKLLTPFDLQMPIKSVLPIRKTSNRYELIPYDEVLIRNDDLKYIVDKISERKPNYDSNWERLNAMNKLVRQSSSLKLEGYYIFVGTSGSKLCAAYRNAEDLDIEKMIIDQTLNWAHVESEDEALYLTGLFNSESVNNAIKIFQPRGQQGERHIHSLPYEVTPKFNAENPLHKEVVVQTANIITEYYKFSSFRAGLLPSNGGLASRRTSARNKIKELSNYSTFEAACQHIYS